MMQHPTACSMCLQHLPCMKLDNHLDTCAENYCEAALLAGVQADTNLGFFCCSTTDSSPTFACTCPTKPHFVYVSSITRCPWCISWTDDPFCPTFNSNHYSQTRSINVHAAYRVKLGNYRRSEKIPIVQQECLNLQKRIDTMKIW